MNPIRFRRILDGPTVAAVHRDLLVPNFPDTELVDVDELISEVTDGAASMIVAADDDGPAGTAVFGGAGGVAILSYLAVGGSWRTGGGGGELLDGAIDMWADDPTIRLVVAEVERPDLHEASAEHGDPERRVRFYARHGGRALNLPFFQPSITAGMPREHGMLLVVLYADGAITVGDGSRLTPEGTALLRRFLISYVGEPESEDEAAQRLFAALDAQPDGVRLVALGDYSVIPASTG